MQNTHLQNRILVLPAFAPNLTTITLHSQFDVRKFLLYWSEERIRLPNFLLFERTQSTLISNTSYSSKTNYDNINGMLNFTIESIPLDLPSPSAEFEVFVRDSILWCSPPIGDGAGLCFHQPRDYGATMNLLFACLGDPLAPCINKTEKNEQFLFRPFEEKQRDHQVN